MKILLSTGGTGGHIFPAQALKEKLVEQGHEVYLAVDERYEKFGEIDGEKVFLIPSAPSSGGVFRKFIAIMKIIVGLLKAIGLIKKINPSIVIGFGGYPSFPACFGAVLLKVPMVIHEQNSVMGKANAFLGKFAKKILLSFEDTLDVNCPEKAVFTGNPVRSQIMRSVQGDKKSKFKKGDKLNILIVGGSLGAQVLGVMIADALSSLPEKYKNYLRVIHQVTMKDLSKVVDIYNSSGIEALVDSFFSDMGKCYNDADLVISRSGATTIAELLMLQKKAIFVPLKSFKDHQYLNAKYMELKGLAWILNQDKDYNVINIQNKIIEIFENPEILSCGVSNEPINNPVYRVIEEIHSCCKKRENI